MSTRTQHILSRAVAGLGNFHLSPDAGGTAGGEPEAKPAEKPMESKPAAEKKPDGKPGEKPAEKPEPKYTDADLDRVLAERLKARDDAAAEQAKKDKAAADAKAAEERGEWQKVATTEKERAATLERELSAERLTAKGRDVDLAIRDHLSDAHPDYPASVAKYIRPLVEFDAGTKADTVAERVKAAAAQYVKDNPRSKSAPAGAPAAPANGARRPYTAGTAPAPTPRRAFAHLYGRG